MTPDSVEDTVEMSSVAHVAEAMTIAAFDQLIERKGETARLFELVDGILVMMSNPTDRHEQIVANIGARLKLAMDRRDCRTAIGGLRVQRSDDSNAFDKPRPDVVVRCGPSNIRDQLLNYVTDPVIVVEVLSPSTMDIDRGRKLEFYQSLETLRHILIVYQDQMRIEHYRRNADGWTVDDALTKPSDRLNLETHEFEMSLAETYFGVTFA